MLTVSEWISAGLRHWRACGKCSAQGNVQYPDWACFKCGAKWEAHPKTTPEFDQDYRDWENATEAEFNSWSRNYSRAGAGDWGDGYEIFQLPPDCPDRVVGSLTEMNSTYRKYGLNPDTHTWEEGQGVRSENFRRRNGKLRVDAPDNYDPRSGG